MIKCINEDVCYNLKCKVCPLDNCRETLHVLEEAERMWLLTHEEIINKQIKRDYPECLQCPFLERRGDNIYCFYRSKEECLLRRKKNEG